jgi:type IV secretory pathway VirB2 component (pilin)
MKNLGNKLKGGIATTLVVLGILLLVSLLLGLPLMLLWNWLMPMIFGLTKITFLQAVGLNFLSGILFKSNNSSNKDD